MRIRVFHRDRTTRAYRRASESLHSGVHPMAARETRMAWAGRIFGGVLMAAGGFLASGPALAASKIDSGDTAWMLTSTALVLMMTIPGLASSMAAWCAGRTC